MSLLSSNTIHAFRHLRKSLQKTLKAAHHDYVHNFLDPQTETNSRKLWRYLQAKRQDSVWVATLKTDGKLISDPKGKAEFLNSQFSSAFTREDMEYLPETGPSHFSLWRPSTSPGQAWKSCF